MKKLSNELPMVNDPVLSYSKVSTFMNCRRMYYFTYVKGYQSKVLNKNYVVGNFVHLGLRNIYSKVSDGIQKTMKFFHVERKNFRKQMIISAEDEQKLNEQEIVIEGILEAYAKKYSKFIRETKHIGSEEEIKLSHTTSVGTKVIGRLDNLLERKGNLYIHEIKTASTVTPDYIRNIKNSFQITLYKAMYNNLYKKKIKGFIFDVIRKPSIRQKQKENKHEFLERLYQYYLNENDPMLFYMEIMDNSLISQDKAFNVLDNVAKDLKNCKTIDDYYHNYNYCFVFSRCQYYDMCMFGENNETLSKFSVRTYGGQK